MTAPRQPAAGGADRVIVRAHLADTGVLSQVIADAFRDLAPCQWLIGDPDARRAILPGYFRMLVEHALADGTVYTTAGRTAAALWVSAGLDGAGQPGGYGERLAEVTGRWAERFAVFEQELEAHHMTGVAHHHLAILAVRPDLQGQGIGTALLDAHHAILDYGGSPAYLEASDERTRGLYLRHGYTDYGSPIQLPGGPPMYPMLRPARYGEHGHATTRLDRDVAMAAEDPDPARHGVFDVDEDRALEALRLAWGDGYDIGHEHGRWVATSRSGRQTTLDSDTPDELNRAIRADWQSQGAP
jgi:GNAT superfamily N-acetyltransferase